MTLMLIPIDLTEGDKKSHPAWNERDYFLVEQSHPIFTRVYSDEYDQYGDEIYAEVPTGEYRSELWFGQFSEVWFGWNFQCEFGVSGGFQYDQPGHNHSSWSRVWKLEGYEELSKDELYAILAPVGNPSQRSSA